MQISIENLGVIKQAELEIGNLTVLCGENNTGKTYATYAYYGFLDFMHNGLFNISNELIPIDDKIIKSLNDDGISSIDLTQYYNAYEKILTNICVRYSKLLHNVFVANPKKFENTKFLVSLNPDEINRNVAFKEKIADFILFEKAENNQELTITRLIEKEKFRFPFIQELIAKSIITCVFKNSIPTNYSIASVERTGATIFKKELYLNRNRILEQLAKSPQKDIDMRSMFSKSYSLYPYPVKDNINFIQELESLQNESTFSKNNPQILENFQKISGGKYLLTKDGDINYLPNKNRQTKLSMVESSSIARALVHLNYYLRYNVEAGSVLIVDEPELNLHPANQRKIARVFAQLVNAGVKVFITTHSDYIVKEFNTLIMLNQDKSHIRDIKNKYGYNETEILSPENIRVYIAMEDYILPQGNSRKTKKNTLIKAEIDEKYGIHLGSFDEVINEMNEIQERIIWGE
jgi:predicted ATP-dependent endonuclease of OLD family